MSRELSLLSEIVQESQVEQPELDTADEKTALNRDIAFDRFESAESKNNTAECLGSPANAPTD